MSENHVRLYELREQLEVLADEYLKAQQEGNKEEVERLLQEIAELRREELNLSSYMASQGASRLGDANGGGYNNDKLPVDVNPCDEMGFY